jgi:hypothetical protein
MLLFVFFVLDACSQTAGLIETKLFLFSVAAAGGETKQVGKIQERRSRAHDRTV